jgi:hypothetical protein
MLPSHENDSEMERDGNEKDHEQDWIIGTQEREFPEES